MAAQPQFSEAKTAQVAAFFLRLHGGRMHYLKLLKLLYIADREALLRWGCPITMDRYVSMDNGPVPSTAYRLVVEDIPKPNWRRYISPPVGDYEVELTPTVAPTGLLSRAEEALIGEVFDLFGRWNRWRIVEHVHTFPEWRNPDGSSIPISLRDILEAGNRSEATIEAVLGELRAEAAAEQALSGSY